MLLEQLREGDTLIVSELSRMGRSVDEIACDEQWNRN